MIVASIPHNETERLEALDVYKAFGTEPETAFDRITSLVSRLLDVPMAFVTLVGQDAQWFKSCLGLSGVCETPRDIAFCAHTILRDEIMIVPDATVDARFSGNPLVTGAPHIRFYAGYPLRTPSGHNIGALCAIDTRPRVFTAEMQDTLKELAAVVVDELELRKWIIDEESQLKHDAETNYRRLADAINGMVFRVRQTSDMACEYLYVSPGSVGLIGISPEVLEADQHAFIKRIHPEDLQSFAQSASRTWTSGVPWSWTGRVTTLDARTKWIQGEGRCERLSDGSAIIEGLLVDITEVREREAALQEAKEAAEQGARAKSEFLSRMSHEFRTPMNAILGFTQMLEMAPLDQEAREDLAQIKKAGGHLLGLINEVLDLASVDSQRVALAIEPVPLVEVIKETTSLLRPLMDARGIRPRPLPEMEDVCVLADRHRLKQIVINLMANAVKYNRPGGEVAVEVVRQDDGVALNITDEGPGIPPDKIERLFTPFDRLGAEDSTIEGTGLGLSISRGLANMMGGSLSVSSVVDEGSTFTVRLPEVECSDRELPGAPETTALPPSTILFTPLPIVREVLYVEDNDSNILLVQRILGKRPEVRLTTAMTLAEGLKRLADSKPGVLLLDLNLPDGSGETIIRWVRTQSPYKDLPIIVLSADAMPAQAEQILSAGADHYLTKPLDVAAFLRTLDDAMEDRS